MGESGTFYLEHFTALETVEDDDEYKREVHEHKREVLELAIKEIDRAHQESKANAVSNALAPTHISQPLFIPELTSDSKRARVGGSSP